LTSFCTGYKK